MNINIEPVNFNASQDLVSHMQKLFEPLSKYNDQITSMDIYLESTEITGKDKRVKAKILAPGHEFFLHEDASDFVTAAQTVFDKMKIKLRDQKERDKENRQKRPDKIY